ncbi:MAG: glycosyltransferase [Chloroflexi bacterium]|nr:glycosyltransferase [Chloroflexota bacterium]
MNIALLSVHTCPLAALGGKETGGLNVYVRELAHELAARGHRVDIFTRVHNPRLTHSVQDSELQVRVFHVPAGNPESYNKQHLFESLPEFTRGVQTLVERENICYDVYHSHYWLSGWVARELQKRQPAPIVHMFHTLGAMKNRVASRSANRESKLRVRVERDILQFVDCIVAATPHDQQQMIKLYGASENKIAIIPPGVSLNRFHPVKANRPRAYFQDKHTILFVGRLDPIKGLDVWFRAMALMMQAHPDWRGHVCACVIGGDADDAAIPDTELARLRTLKNDLGLNDVITFMGKRLQESLPSYYASADVVVMPSRYESFGMAALEAMACGTPVVASAVGGLSFVVRDGETGFLVPENDPQALANCLGKLLGDSGLRKRLGECGAQVARGYAWSRIAEQIEQVYNVVNHALLLPSFDLAQIYSRINYLQ